MEIKMDGEQITLRWAANGRGKPAVIAQRDGEPLFAERADLLDSKARERLARRLHQACGLAPAEAQRVLMGFGVEWLEWQQRADAEQRTSPEQGEALRWEPSAEARRQAERLLEQPNLLGHVLDVAAELGVVNERALVATAFLVGTTRLCEKPGYLLIQGDPSTGKSFVASVVAKLFPPTVVEDFTDVSPMALYYVSAAGLSLKRKLVVFGERRRQTTDESIDCTRALRELHESGRLSKLVAAKKHGQPTAVRVALEGAPAIIETVSHNAIPAEDLSRAIVCWTDETRSQTMAVNLDYARRKSGHAPSLDPVALEVVRACQWLLEPYEVHLPLEAVAKKFPVDTPESRRALRRLGVVAEASALLHQRQRRATESALVGELDDLRLAWRLLRPWLRNRLVAGPPPSVERIWAAVREIGEQFTADDLDRQKLGSKATVWRALRHLEKAGAIRDTGERGPRQTRVYTVVDPDWQPDDLPIELDELLGDETMKRSGCC
jgi:hypothetical protein